MTDPRCPICASGLDAFGETLTWLSRCRGCGLVLQRDRSRDPIELAEEHYGDAVLSHRTRILPVLERVAARRWTWLDTHLQGRKPGRLLEVGCATGEFLAAARAGGWDVAGIEPSPAFRDDATARHGLSLSARPFGPGQVEPGSLEGLALLHVFEHLPDPGTFLGATREALAPGGFVFLIVPNLESTTDRPYGEGAMHLAKRDHLFHYTPRTLERMLTAHGFTTLAVESIEPRHHLWTGLHGYLANRRRGGALADSPGPGPESDTALRRLRSRLPYILGDALAPLTWPYRTWISRRGHGHEILALFQRP